VSEPVRLLPGGSPWRALVRLDTSGRSEGAVVRAICRGATRAVGVALIGLVLVAGCTHSSSPAASKPPPRFSRADATRLNRSLASGRNQRSVRLSRCRLGSGCRLLLPGSWPRSFQSPSTSPVFTCSTTVTRRSPGRRRIRPRGRPRSGRSQVGACGLSGIAAELGALVGTRTPSLLIRSYRQAPPD
jgi:hypothetical protein